MRQLLKIARMGHPILRRVAKPVDPQEIDTREFQDWVDSMIDTMLEYDGVGLAAPQVHVSKRVVVFHEEAGLKAKDGKPLTCLINPEIKALTRDVATTWEGCLSVPGLRGKVSRPRKIEVEALDRHGEPVHLVLGDFDAVVTQHECDHLDGVLFVDRLDDTRQLSYLEEFDRYWVKHEEDSGTYVDR
jgi:peptide deformylase